MARSGGVGGTDATVLAARALVLADLEARGLAVPAAVTILEEACSERRWWLEQWAEGAPYVAGLVAQDVQERLVDTFGRTAPEGLWPVCTLCDEDGGDGPLSGVAGPPPVHTVVIDPDLGGPDPHWVCEESGRVVAALGRLAPGSSDSL